MHYSRPALPPLGKVKSLSPFPRTHPRHHSPMKHTLMTSAAMALAAAALWGTTGTALVIVVVGERPQWGAFAGLGLLLVGLGFVLWTESKGAGRG